MLFLNSPVTMPAALNTRSHSIGVLEVEAQGRDSRECHDEGDYSKGSSITARVIRTSTAEPHQMPYYTYWTVLSFVMQL